MYSKLVLISALLCLVSADVSEVIRRSSNGRAAVKSYRQVQQQSHKLKARQTDSDFDVDGQAVFETVFIEDPVDHNVEALVLDAPLGSTVETAAAAASFQLPESHPDFQGPYHYEKPVPLTVAVLPIAADEYVEPQPAPVNVDYLPPHAADFADSVAKRSIKLRLRG